MENTSEEAIPKSSDIRAGNKTRTIEWLNEIARVYESGLLRLLTLGNAGGMIATLGFIGTLLGGSLTYDRRAFWVLVAFIVGTAASAWARYCEWRIVSYAKKSLQTSNHKIEVEHVSRMKTHQHWGGVAVLISLTALAFGIGYGLWIVWKFGS